MIGGRDIVYHENNGFTNFTKQYIIRKMLLMCVNILILRINGVKVIPFASCKFEILLQFHVSTPSWPWVQLGLCKETLLNLFFYIFLKLIKYFSITLSSSVHFFLIIDL